MFMQQQNQQYGAGSPDMPHMPYVNGKMREQNQRAPSRFAPAENQNSGSAQSDPEEQKDNDGAPAHQKMNM